MAARSSTARGRKTPPRPEAPPTAPYPPPAPWAPPLPAPRPANEPWKVVAIVVGSLVVLLFLFLVLGRSGGSDEPATDLVVEDIFTALANDTAGNQTVRVDVLLTNTGTKASGPVRVRAVAVNRESNLVIDQNDRSIGAIPKDRTATASVNLTFPPDTYDIQVLIFEDERLVRRIEGSVDTSGFRNAEPFREVPTEPEPRSTKTPAPGLAFVAAALLGGLGLGRARRRP